MSSPQIYTAADIERYHRGEMSMAEMHDLERAALDDPMLADALDGYRHREGAENEVHLLRERLKQRMGENRKRGLLVIGSPLWRVAALFIVIAGGGWMVLQIFSGNKNKIASRTDAATETTTQELVADSTATVQLAPDTRISDSLKPTDEVVASRTTTTKNRESRPQTASPSSSANTTDAGVKAEEAKMAAASAPAADHAKRSDIAALKSNAPVTTATEAPDTTAQQNVVVQTSPENRLPAAARRSADFTKATRENTAPAAPENGWPAFEQYVKKNRNRRVTATDKSITDNAVELSFDVDANNRPVNIQVTKSLCGSCDTEAIRLLKEGPKWKSVNAKGKVRIQF